MAIVQKLEIIKNVPKPKNTFQATNGQEKNKHYLIRYTSPKPAQNQALFTFILPNSNWKTLGLVA